jgi:hypothetical protein
MISSGFGNTLDQPSGDRVEPAKVAPGDERASAAGQSVASDDLERLRELLLGDERRALDTARVRIAALESAQDDLPRRLPDAAIAALRSEGDNPRVADALADPLTQALGAAVQRNRQSLVDTLFPVIGPLIRKAIAEALRNLVNDLNGAIESSFSVRGLKWRIEALRGGVPYAQVVLKHRLAYRIDHVFLIERASGIVLQHEAAPELPPLDADAVAGMLTALGDFVGDSVGHGSGDTLESMRVGEYLVWVVQGPRANLACFMRGVPPAELRALLEQRLEEIHARIASSPDRANPHAPGSTDIWHELLEPTSLLRAADLRTPSTQPARSRWPLLLGLALILLALGGYVASRERWNTRIDGLRAQLVAHPGFVLTGLDSKPWRSVAVHGLLDPDAAPLDGMLAEAGLAGIESRLDIKGYLSTADSVVASRANRLLAPTAGVRLTVKDGVLSLGGNAPDAWIAGARERAGWIAGVSRVEFALMPQVDAAKIARAELDTLLGMLPTLYVPFASGTQTEPPAESIVDDIARNVRRALELARAAHVELVLASVGTNDDSGSSDTNAHVREARARWLVDALAARGVAAVIATDAAGNAQAMIANRRSAHVRASIRRSQP